MAEEKIRIVGETVLADDYYPLKKVKYEQLRSDGGRQEQEREVYDAASGAAVLLYNRERRTVVLTRQFRLGAFLNGSDGFLLEAAAGVLEGAAPADRVIAEAREETGYEIGHVDPVMQLFVSPGSLTERIHLFVAEYDPSRRSGEGGGKPEEGEDIEVVEMDFDDALALIDTGGIIDAKTVLLLLHLERRVLGRHEAS
ncbi:GDP-mannose pyrophosphatase NudK [Massilia sp. Bi118]|uniref:NUDIX domain-containing protein n=1 Tax=Massilia sp. Bi118 TaxID=2822346 RepID=UPI001D1C7287|nr:NUDIX domain-containing protein [Massilia sp. Bi118]CAH0305618.1 GDP-mannose pyrophosphatase NudK [Massilia sp. Bi118]